MTMSNENLIRLAYAGLGKVAKNIPADVERYVQEHLDQGNDESKAWALAWSRYCAYKNPGSDHCKQNSYFPGKKKATLRAATIKLAFDNPGPVREALLPILAAAKYPRVLHDIENDFNRRAITVSEKNDMQRRVRDADSEEDAWRIVDEARRGRTASAAEPGDFRRALQLLVGPGFGQPGLSASATAQKLIAGGMARQQAFFAVKGAVQLAKRRGIQIGG